MSLATFLQAQGTSENPERVLISYEDGSYLVGDIVKETADYLYLRLTTSDTVKLTRSSIKTTLRTSDHFVYQKAKYHFKKGFFASASVTVGTGGYDQATSQVELLLGYRYTKKWSLGLGIGSDYSQSPVSGLFGEHYFNPLFAYGRYYLKNTRVRPYVDMRLGYGFANDRNFDAFQQQEFSGGIYAMPGFGIHVASKNKVKWHLGIGQYFQKASGQNEFSDARGLPVVTQWDLLFNRTVLRIGVEYY